LQQDDADQRDGDHEVNDEQDGGHVLAKSGREEQRFLARRPPECQR
jgi:hypothetical protein